MNLEQLKTEWREYDQKLALSQRLNVRSPTLAVAAAVFMLGENNSACMACL